MSDAKRDRAEQVQFRLNKLARKFAEWNFPHRNATGRTVTKLNLELAKQVSKLVGEDPNLRSIYSKRWNELNKRLGD